jgi:hypothetical protein
MTTNAFRHPPPEQCTLSKEDQQHILRISNNDQELLDELMAILRQLRPLPPRGASVRHTTVDVTDARNIRRDFIRLLAVGDPLTSQHPRVAVRYQHIAILHLGRGGKVPPAPATTKP